MLLDLHVHVIFGHQSIGRKKKKKDGEFNERETFQDNPFISYSTKNNKPCAAARGTVGVCGLDSGVYTKCYG